jgi:hypothetical protein
VSCIDIIFDYIDFVAVGNMPVIAVDEKTGHMIVLYESRKLKLEEKLIYDTFPDKSIGRIRWLVKFILRYGWINIYTLFLAASISCIIRRT